MNYPVYGFLSMEEGTMKQTERLQEVRTMRFEAVYEIRWIRRI